MSLLVIIRHHHFITIESIDPLQLLLEYLGLIFRMLQLLYCNSKHHLPYLLLDVPRSQRPLYLL